MKVKCIKTVQIEGNEYKVVKIVDGRSSCYGTLDSGFLDGNRLNRELNGLYLLVANTVEEAIQNRKDNIEASKILELINKK